MKNNLNKRCLTCGKTGLHGCIEEETFKVCGKCGKDGTVLEIDIHDCTYEHGE